MSRRVTLLIEPLDVLFFRDGRPFEGSIRAVGGLPMPQTLAGALRTYLWGRLGIDFFRMQDTLKQKNGDVIAAARSLLPSENAWAAEIRVRGPWFCDPPRTETAFPKPYLPMPADLARKGRKDKNGDVIRLRPTAKPINGWHPPRSGMVPLWHREEEEIDRAIGYLDFEGLEEYLNGDVPSKERLLASEDLYLFENRTGVAIDEDTFSAKEHMLFSQRFLRLKENVYFCAEVELPDGAGADANSLFEAAIPFGGERRHVRLSVTKEIVWPKPEQKTSETLALLATPGIFKSDPNWLPETPDLATLRAAAVSGSIPVSGWDLVARRPKPMRHAVIPGSVYFFEKDFCSGDAPFARLCSGDEMNTLGYGLALKGVWKYE